MADDQEARVGQCRPQLQNIQRRDLSGGFPMTMFFLVRNLTTDEGRRRFGSLQCRPAWQPASPPVLMEGSVERGARVHRQVGGVDVDVDGGQQTSLNLRRGL